MICEADGRSEVEAMLADLPLTRAGFLGTEIIEFEPFHLWTTLFARPIGGTSADQEKAKL